MRPGVHAASVFLTAAIALEASVAAGQTATGVPQLAVSHLAGEERPAIDGHVDDPGWSAATPFSAFIQQEPNDGEPGTERTEVRFLLDRASAPTCRTGSRARRDTGTSSTS